ncbi:hypothetical protein Asphe3_10160 [Pseudarthrobacter phenanthrenivorans Sphe3]|uniref:Uncharacterized protein n=1 Tax=Pseudarthrobacter phenanthrenivorans (strain DSM 18606 / JCM 16027 / LMG 23796 / Sphe3) TaxID=930171 RepID=F0M3I2_PSEPM|nr:hypothetical protein [Pseudarthrobacter phenanthrenivorans]ADX72201.1 hypothetical protein Asphe3_10160 [Pseudarthrobacter phenanthrenivorans Sphe3]
MERTIDDLTEVGEVHRTPHAFYSDSLKIPTPKAKLAAVQAVMEAFSFDRFDAETLVSAAADVSQIRDAVRRVRYARRGAVSVSYIELDVVTWRIVPSPENIRFEDSRVRTLSLQSRFSSLPDAKPVLTFETASGADLGSRLDNEADLIYEVNEHAATIADRGIETPGLLSVARIISDDKNTVGVLDSTDGFGRTVGAHRALGITASEALWKFTNDVDSLALRRDLVKLKVNPHNREDRIGEHLSEDNRRKLRASVMIRAQIIVGFSSVGTSSTVEPRFDQIRRTLVGHIHIEPPKPFALGTQYAIKATAAVQALDANGSLPEVDGFVPEEISAVFTGTSNVVHPIQQVLKDGRDALLADEVFVLSLEALRGRGGSVHKRSRIINGAIRELTGQTPSPSDRTMIAADLALRLGELAVGTVKEDKTYESRRSAVERAIRGKIFNDISLIRNSVPDLLDAALAEVEEDLSNVSPHPHCAVLAGLGLYHMVGMPNRRLLERATKKDSADQGYISEPNVVMDSLASKKRGLKQLAQIIFDGRAGRLPQELPLDQEPTDAVFQDGNLATAASIRQTAGMAPVDIVPVTPSRRLLISVGDLKSQIQQLSDRIEAIEAIRDETSESQVSLISERGAALAEEVSEMQRITFKLHRWNEILSELAETAAREAAQADLDALDLLDR